jgi:multimeric flavodoxin WrbA
MKALGLCGSARRDGNTGALIQAALEGAAGQGLDTEMLFFNELSLKNCEGCLKCQDGTSDGCALNDKYNDLIDRVRGADLVVIGSPVYTGQVTAQVKNFLDRLYAVSSSSKPIQAPGKQGITVTTLGSGNRRDAEETRKMLNVLFWYMRCSDVVDIVGAGLFRLGDIKRHQDLLAQARKAGTSQAAKLTRS